MAKLTKRPVDALTARLKPYVAFDADVKGFGCRVMPSGSKTFILEYRPGSGGRLVAKKRLTLGRYGAMTVEQARAAALTALARIRLGADPQAEKASQRASLSVGELIDAFVKDHVDSKLKAKTAKSYAAGLERLRTAYGSLKAERLARAHVASMHTAFVASPFAANRFLAVISKMFSWAEGHGLVAEGHANPAGRIERYKEPRHERFLNSDELARLGDALAETETIGLPYMVSETNAKHAPKPENRLRPIDPYAVAAIRLLILTGARLHEILHARWSEVDFERGMIFLGDSKTGKKPIYLSAAALMILSTLPRAAGSDFVIPGELAGRPRADLKRPWKAIKQAAGLNGVRLHDLRHSFASAGAAASLGLPIIGKLLGHSQAATTHRYAHLDADPMRRAVETIGATIDGAMRRKTADVVRLRQGS
jgi:integrase